MCPICGEPTFDFESLGSEQTQGRKWKNISFLWPKPIFPIFHLWKKSLESTSSQAEQRGKKEIDKNPAAICSLEFCTTFINNTFNLSQIPYVPGIIKPDPPWSFYFRKSWIPPVFVLTSKAISRFESRRGLKSEGRPLKDLLLTWLYCADIGMNANSLFIFPPTKISNYIL